MNYNYTNFIKILTAIKPLFSRLQTTFVQIKQNLLNQSPGLLLKRILLLGKSKPLFFVIKLKCIGFAQSQYI